MGTGSQGGGGGGGGAQLSVGHLDGTGGWEKYRPTLNVADIFFMGFLRFPIQIISNKLSNWH